MNDVGLILEGGGSRGVYTAGVLQYLMEENIYFPYVIGVSSGACNGSSYLSRQLHRNKRVNIDYVDHPDYLSLKNWFTKRQLFGMDFLFDKIMNHLDPFDYETFYQAKEEFVVTATDCMTGEAVYFHKSLYAAEMITLIRASSSLPLIAPAIHFHDRVLLDGGITSPIPIEQSMIDGNRKNVVILTKNRGYIRKAEPFYWMIRRKYRNYPGLIQSIEKRHHIYNDSLQYLYDEEKKGNVFIICPSEKVNVGRIEKNKDKLIHLYQQGYKDMKNTVSQLVEFCSQTNPVKHVDENLAICKS
ncbi:Predicted phospholipase, patatin/cPLA2 family [Gracilibacillus ureilyticus]|uniref:Predicted phospholipase, patatin/cPLA2 family n=1 Tax=Gracilibacillus ureilyticus TaxID=531814 RepID=A0A1H9M6T5_9BACI|nr:patatin family protein [Gracilibacillus ureilyticus]SER19398.1 Predicted phospholipase, patatin/cPLA2 family [Gracilibacillus ureilyticus]